jgi:cytochrome P450
MAKTLSEFSMLDPHVNSEPWDMYAEIHKECPVYQMPETGAFLVTKYDDLRQVLRDPETFSSDVRVASMGQFEELQRSILVEGGGWEHVQTLQRTDPPEHGRYRRLIDRVFTIKRVRELTPRIDQVVSELIDNFIEKGECDFNDEFAMRMPGIIIAEQLGLDHSQVSTFKKWADAMLGASRSAVAGEEEIRGNAKIELEAQLFFAKIFEERRAAPQNDLMSAFVHSQTEDEDPLSMHELQNMMHQLITGGFETTQSAINHGMWALIRYPELVVKLKEDASLLKSFIEEVLRWEAPVQFLARRATKDVELNGTLIPKDSMILVGYGPASRDESKFECPHQFDIERSNVGAHLAFGSGGHFCPGALLARQEMMSSFSGLIQRLDNIELARPLPAPVHNFSLFFLPMKEFHVKFTKA